MNIPQLLRSRRRRRVFATGAVLAALWLVPPTIHSVRRLCPVRPDGVATASAVPAYSRKYSFGCSQCHTAFPVLNDFGRRFKFNGYTIDSDDTVLKSKDGSLWTEKLFPISVVVRSRPYDRGVGSVSNAGAWSGGSNGSAGEKLQPVNDVDFFVAGGDVARRLSWLGEIDANAAGGFAPTIGDMQLGYHPSQYLNLILARKNFYAMDPYQTLSSMESVTVANRATDGMEADQNGLSGNTLTEQTQTLALVGDAEREGLGGLYYMAGVTASNGDNTGGSPKSGNLRLAFDTLKGLVIGGFATAGHEQPATIAGNPNTPYPGSHVKFSKAGVDALLEAGNVVARAAFLWSYDFDPLGVGLPATGKRAFDRAGYAEAMYVYRRGADAPFLIPMIRENWYTTFNGKRQFNYVTAHLEHFFAENVKAFVEYSFDTKSDPQGLADPTRAPRGNRVTGQLEVGF